MKRSLYFFPLLVLVVLQLTGCATGDMRARLSLADSLMMEEPDSALSIIESIDTALLRSHKDLARYSLLHTMAVSRSGADITDYSLIKAASEYYSNHGSVSEKARAYFYEGIIYLNQHDYVSAQRCLLGARDAAEELKDDWLHGMIFYYLAETYNGNYLHDEEILYGKKSLDAFKEFGRDSYIHQAINKLAVAYHNGRHYDKADSLFSIVPANSPSHKYALLGMAGNELTKKAPDPQRAISLFGAAQAEGAPFTLATLYQYAYALLLDGQDDAAGKLLSRLDGEIPDLQSLWWKYAVERVRKNDKKALELYEEYAKRHDIFISSLLNQSLFKANSDYISAEKEIADKRAIILKQSIIILSLLFVLVLMIAYFAFHIKSRRLKEERDKFLQRVNDLQDLLDSINSPKEDADPQGNPKSALQTCYISLYREQFSELSRLIGTNPAFSIPAESMKDKLTDYINGILSDLQSDDGKSAKFEDRINRSLDNVILKLRQDFPRFTDETIRFLCLVIAGFKDQAIASIMGKSTSAVRTRKSRLRQKILSATTSNLALYKSVLN